MSSTRLEKVIRRSSRNYRFSRPSREIIQRYLEKTVESLVHECEREAKKHNYRKVYIDICLTRDICEKYLVSPTNTKPSEYISLLKEENNELGEQYGSENVEVA